MRAGSIRPRFTIDVAGDAGELISRITRAVEGQSDRLVCRVVGRHVDITVVRERRKRWSPSLAIEFEDAGDGAGDGERWVRVRALVGPHPSVWTMYALAAIAVIFLLVTALVVAYAQHAIDGSPSAALWWAGGFAGMLLGMYAASQVGRRLSREQTRELVEFLRETLEPATGPGRG